MIYLQLFLAFLKIGVFGFGGGYAMLSLIQTEIVENYGWVTNSELADILAVSQMTPGPIAINSATYVGYTVAGNVWGALLATLAVCLPSLVIMLVITRFYLRLRGNRFMEGAMSGMQPMVLGLILSASLLLMTPDTFIDWKSWLLFGACLLASVKKMNPIYLILLSGVAGVLIYY